jgi:hypothetical protein
LLKAPLLSRKPRVGRRSHAAMHAGCVAGARGGPLARRPSSASARKDEREDNQFSRDRTIMARILRYSLLAAATGLHACACAAAASAAAASSLQAGSPSLASHAGTESANAAAGGVAADAGQPFSLGVDYGAFLGNHDMLWEWQPGNASSFIPQLWCVDA